MKDRERQRYRKGEKQATCGQAQCGTQFQDPGITPWAKGRHSTTQASLKQVSFSIYGSLLPGSSTWALCSNTPSLCLQDDCNSISKPQSSHTEDWQGRTSLSPRRFSTILLALIGSPITVAQRTGQWLTGWCLGHVWHPLNHVNWE